MKNWLHLDWKGAIPGKRKLLESLTYWKQIGFTGVVLEYDDRIPWQTWPGTWRKGYTAEEYQEILAHCRELKLEVVPLIQIQGHLEWLLKQEQYAALRENGQVSELCPLHPEVRGRLKQWINEVASKNPDSRCIHLGGDETWHLAECPLCRKKAEQDPRGKLGVYLDHVSEMCRHAVSKGLRPLIWADMFPREKRMDLAALLPPETVLVDWQYDSEPPYPTTAELLAEGGHEIFGASGVMIGWWEHCYRIQSDPLSRIRNTSSWTRWAEQNCAGVLHTTWTRGASLWNIYGCWHGQLPAMIAGASPEAWETHPWKNAMEEISAIILRDLPTELSKGIGILEGLNAENPMEESCLDWLKLALRYQSIEKELHIADSTRRTLDKVSGFVGRDPDCYEKNCIRPYSDLLSKLETLEQDMHRFWTVNDLSDEAEFLATHTQILREIMQEALPAKQ